jgi:hypothetical protein
MVGASSAFTDPDRSPSATKMTTFLRLFPAGAGVSAANVDVINEHRSAKHTAIF